MNTETETSEIKPEDELSGKAITDGSIVCHILSEKPMVAICNTSDGMVDCRYIDENGVFLRQFFYKFELLTEKKEPIDTAGFVMNKGR
jgi:uncharacterized protein YodC (DUF2158 family)